MTTWVLLLRAVNLGPRNKLPMADLRQVLTDLGYGEVKTHLNSGNATFTSSGRPPAGDIEDGLRQRLGLDVRVTVRTQVELQQALDAMPDLDGYVLVSVLLERPEPSALAAALATDWSPETVVAGNGVLYLSYPNGVHRSKMTTARLEKALGVATTARTPATLRKLL